jgi:hypothetical protein
LNKGKPRSRPFQGNEERKVGKEIRIDANESLILISIKTGYSLLEILRSQ